MADIGADAGKEKIYEKYPRIRNRLDKQVVNVDRQAFDDRGEVNYLEYGKQEKMNVAKSAMFVYIDKKGENINNTGADSYMYDAPGFVDLVNDNYLFILPDGVYLGGSRLYKKSRSRVKKHRKTRRQRKTRRIHRK